MTSPLEATFLQLILDDGLPEPLREYRFAQEIGRQWRADFAWPDSMVLAEAEGGVWTKGRHVRGQGFIDDCEKYNTAALLGWTVLRFPPVMIADGTAVKMIRKALDVAGH
jgi:very-short-patch-repair endonuclease